jgi:DNA-binding transcriptional regulator GbsR (MarR family)
MGAKEEFIELMADNAKANGLDELSCKLIAILYAEPGEIALEELSHKTGYSLSALSTTLKMAEQFGLVKRIKKPGSKKAYFYVEKGMFKMFANHFTSMYEHIVLPSKQRLPEIIQKYKSEKSKDAKEGAKIAEHYYREILAFDRVFSKMNAELKVMARKI